MQKQHVAVKADGRREWSSRAAERCAAVVAVDRELARLALAAPRDWRSPVWLGRGMQSNLNPS
jgi:hypothetical protein